MSIFSSRRVGSLLLYLLFHIEGVFGRGGGRGGGRVGHVGGGSSDLGLPPVLDAVFALSLVIAFITLYQLERSLLRFKRLSLPEGEPTLPYDVGALFRTLLSSYTAIYFVNNVLYAVYIASFGDTFILPFNFQIGVAFTGQLSLVLFYATFLSIIAYRQRIQLNPEEKLFNLKTFLDGLLLAIILILGIAEDGIAGTSRSIKDRVTIENISIAYEVFSLLASFDVAISSYMARSRLSYAGIHDKIINISAFAASPIVVAGGIFGIIGIGLRHNTGLFLNRNALLIATVVIQGLVSILAIACCLLMGAPPKPPKADNKGGVVETKA